jgi:hypothetical protein
MTKTPKTAARKSHAISGLLPWSKTPTLPFLTECCVNRRHGQRASEAEIRRMLVTLALQPRDPATSIEITGVPDASH